MIKIIIADDHQEVRNAWNMFLSASKDIEVVAECTDGEEVMAAAAKFSPDIVLMDINMKKMTGIEATRQLSAANPAVKVIGVSFHSTELYIRRMLDAGAKGYVVKHAVVEELIPAIVDVYAGKIYLCKEAKIALKQA